MLSAKLLDSLPQAIRLIRKLYSDCLDGSVTLQQLRVLVLITEGQGLTQIAETLQITSAAVSRMVSGLEKKGFIRRETGMDKRSQNLKLSPQGKKILSVVKRHVEKKLKAGLAKLDVSQRNSLAEGLEVLDKLMILVKEG